MAASSGLASRLPFSGFVSDEDSRAAVVEAASKANVAPAEVVIAHLEDVILRLKSATTPKVLLVDIADIADPLAEMTRLADVCDPGTQVITLGAVNDVRLYRDLRAFGVHDYLIKPVAAVDLARSLKQALQPQEGELAQAEMGRLIAVVGARGGVGSTAMAVNLAWSLSRVPDRKVAIVDFDLFFGNCSLALDLEVGRGFREALENPARIDALFIERAMVRVEDNLFLLSAEESLENRVVLDPKPLEVLLKHLRLDFTHVVIDLPRFAVRTQASLLTPPASIVLVSDPTLAGLRDTTRLQAFLRKHAAEADLSVVLNRVGANPKGELPVKDFEKESETRVKATIPFDPNLFGGSSGSGKPIGKLKPKAKAVVMVDHLCTQMGSDKRERGAKTPVWKRLLSRPA